MTNSNQQIADEELRASIERILGKLQRPNNFIQRVMYSITDEWREDAKIDSQANKIMTAFQSYIDANYVAKKQWTKLENYNGEDL